MRNNHFIGINEAACGNSPLNLGLYFKNYKFCEYAKFGVNSWKFDILLITVYLKILAHVWYA